ncbi:MAG: hypothetical protein JSV74_03285 [Dehalococcoidia bacterium]|nr:MAG: hypothetical protein JSV74_03285 [Dehalococcoidia bacterium]
MNTNLELKELERKIFTSYFNDGMWDLYGGIVLLGFGLTMLTNLDYLIVAFIALAMVPLIIRNRVVIPRLGVVKFSPERQAKTRKSKLAAMIALTFTALLGMVFFILYSANAMPYWLENWMHDHFLTFFGGMVAVLVLAAAFLVSVKRFYLYAIAVFIAFFLASTLRSQDMEGIPITVAGGLILSWGIFILVRFLRNHPQSQEEIT